MNARSATVAALAGFTLFLSACGGEGGGGMAMSGTVGGTVVKGPVGGASVTAYAISGGLMGARIGSGHTDSAGNFSFSVGDYAGSLMLRASGGTYMDEATGSSMGMLSGDVLVTCIPAMTAGATTSGIQITPLTSMASSRAMGMAGGMTPANITSANGAVEDYFSVSDIVFTHPMDPTVMGSGTGATQDMKNYGMTLAAMSEYAQTIGMMTSSSGIVTAMMDDASDGIMDGKMGSAAISMNGMGGMMGGMMQATAGSSGLATAMSTFIGSGMNTSGVQAGDMQALMDKLAASTGVIE